MDVLGYFHNNFGAPGRALTAKLFFFTWHLLRHTAALEGTAAAAAHIGMCQEELSREKSTFTYLLSLSYLVSGWLDSEAGKQVELRQ